MDSVKKIFTENFNLGRQQSDGLMPCDVKSSKKGKTRITFPCVYLYDAPKGLAGQLRKLAAESDENATYALVLIKPTRTSEETLIDNKDQAREERDNVEFDILELSLPEVGSEENTDEDAMASIAAAAKAAGVKGIDIPDEETD